MTECTLKQLLEGRFSGFQVDSRLITPGDLFFALKGEKVDGHAFLAAVRQKGAAAAVISKSYQGELYGLNCIAVDDVLATLQSLAQRVHALRSPRVIAVTGSVGKTTTKEFIATLLEKKYKLAKTPGNANSQTGLPLSILNAKGDAELWVLEMGMSEPQEITRLIAIAPPEISLITRIALAHAEFFPDGLEGIAAAKAEIFSHPLTRLGILSAQAASYKASRHTGTFPKIRYALEEGSTDADVLLFKEGQSLRIREEGKESPLFTLPFTASHLSENFLGAAIVARKMGMEWEEIFERAKELKLEKNRFQILEKNGVIFLNDSYNANPASMQAALFNLPTPSKGGRKIGVLGAIRPLGTFAEESHRQLGSMALECVDHLLCLGEECAPMIELFERAGRPAELHESVEALKARVHALALPGDVVLIKGSNSNQLWKILEEV